MKKTLFFATAALAITFAGVANADDQSTAYNRYGVSAPAQSVEVPAPTQADIDAYTNQEVHYAQAQAKPADPEQVKQDEEALKALYLALFGGE